MNATVFAQSSPKDTVYTRKKVTEGGGGEKGGGGGGGGGRGGERSISFPCVAVEFLTEET